LDYFRSRLFWQGGSEKKKYGLTELSVVCRPKDQGEGSKFITLRSRIELSLENGF
jgi:hypothetical protein